MKVFKRLAKKEKRFTAATYKTRYYQNTRYYLMRFDNKKQYQLNKLYKI